ncbi:5'-methylthioadenosine/S-adenosylhomocysteine nucleosidase family protein [Actinacidiphila soli]|uniref:5'-methylthioadenosine/S-adenosylhomocysteine nucleosidase family protein n=1 Tax=Actinacidiphila soli TaxID=2487275 RepID=UPI000FCA3BA1|nr:1-hydroxy-2-methyl-2-butenyl 4-diphosphate reductase [Actinacidiphila soli]
MGQSGPPLLIVCALRFERFALRAGRRRMDAAAGPVRVIRTGMGAQAAERAVTDALSTPEMKNAAVLTTGLCAGLAPGMRPGDVVVADEAARDSDTLAAALKAAGHTVHIGRLAQSDHVVRGAERAELRATGAIAVDMESAAMMRAALAQGAHPVAAARVVVDTPEYELVRVGTLRTGITAFRVLRDLLPAFLNWHRSTALPWR